MRGCCVCAWICAGTLSWRNYLSSDEREDVHLPGVRVLDGGNDEAGSAQGDLALRPAVHRQRQLPLPHVKDSRKLHALRPAHRAGLSWKGQTGRRTHTHRQDSQRNALLIIDRQSRRCGTFRFSCFRFRFCEPDHISLRFPFHWVRATEGGAVMQVSWSQQPVGHSGVIGYINPLADSCWSAPLIKQTLQV